MRIGVLPANFFRRVERANDRRRRAVRNRGAHVERQRVDHDARLHDLLDHRGRRCCAKRVERAISGVLHRRLGEIRDGPAILLHPRLEIDLGMNGVAGRELHAHLRQVELGDGGKCADGAGAVADEHLLGADRERDVGGAGSDLQPGATQGRRRAGAGVLDVDDRNSRDARMLQTAPDRARPLGRSKARRANCRHRRHRISSGLTPASSSASQIAVICNILQRLVGELAGRMRADADDGDLTHGRFPPADRHILVGEKIVILGRVGEGLQTTILMSMPSSATPCSTAHSAPISEKMRGPSSRSTKALEVRRLESLGCKSRDGVAEQAGPYGRSSTVLHRAVAAAGRAHRHFRKHHDARMRRTSRRARLAICVGIGRHDNAG